MPPPPPPPKPPKPPKPSKPRASKSARNLGELSERLEQHFEGEPEVHELSNFLQGGDLRSLLAMHDSLKRLQKQRRKAGPDSEAFPGVSQTEYVRSLHDTLEQLETVAATDDEANDLYELLASGRLNTFVEALEDIGHRNYEGDRLRKARNAENDEVAAASAGLHESAVGGASAESPGPLSGRAASAATPVFSDGNDDDAFGAAQTLQPQPTGDPMMDDLDEFDRPQKMVAFAKMPGEDLGITVGTIEWYDDNTGQSGLDIVVERIMAGSRIEQQGVLKPYDVIKEVNGIPIDSPEKLQQVMRKASGNVTLKVRSGFYEAGKGSQTYVKALFSYDPQYDGLIPCKEAGLKFTVGDVLQVLSQEDPNWWQARRWDNSGRAGLIPSLTLQERRTAFLQSTPDKDAINYKVMGLGLAKKKKTVRVAYKANVAQSFQRSDLTIYQEVARVPPFRRSLILLLGAPGVGKASLITQLIKHHPETYARPIPHTSRPPRQGEVNGERYLFAGQQEMEVDVHKGAYLEYGQLNGSMYGIKIDTLRSMAKQDRTLLVDCAPDRARQVCTAEFKPYVVFIAAPSFDCMKSMYELGSSLGLTNNFKRDEDFRKSIQQSIHIERTYRHLFDSVLICDNFDSCYEQLEAVLESLTTEHQWLPVHWLY
ncbi:hypothetical protein BOX15_Mlig011536g5 [Macrostomum lignano]|uniref:MAGUK p55 subfamily member 6-like n=2 Tax=Macrostomum lignano TaxID=282301 RepID=A0A1I8J317_9PLAT|nr:hypothetical protein BOX15_Mlig011536g4 [Macrostomum lignano]PAA84665.1 hypothetical protein BOX15_Mlig011536g5 [Macrostomum lignano]